MLFEIVSAYTKTGILKNTQGFCPVAITAGTPGSLIKPVFDLARRQVQEAGNLRKNAETFASHFPIVVSGKNYSLLTRGTRIESNAQYPFVVHQMLFDQANLKTAGPAAILNHESNWITRWSGQSQTLKPRDFEVPPLSPRICVTWEEITGDPGWASAPIEAWEHRNCCVLLTPNDLGSRQIFKLFTESQSLIPHEFRWHIPFSIGAWHPFGNDHRFWLAFDRDCQAAIDSMQRTDTVRIDLTGQHNRASGRFSQEARSGSWIRLNLKSDSSERSSDQPAEQELTLMPQIDRVSEETLRVAKQSDKAGNMAIGSNPGKRKFKTKTEFDRKRAKTAASVSDASRNKKLDNSRWIRYAIAAATLAVLGLAVWFGLTYLNRLTETMSSIEAPAILPSKTGDSVNQLKPETPVIPETKPSLIPPQPLVSKPNSVENVSPKPAASINASMVVNAFQSGYKNMRWLNLEVEPESPRQKLFSIPFGSNLIVDHFDVALSTDSDHSDLEWDQEQRAWLYEDPRNGDLIAKVFCLAESDSEDNPEVGTCDFFWEWLYKPDQRVSFDEIRAGQLRFQIKQIPGKVYTTSLAAPTESPSFVPLNSVVQPVKFKPPLGSYLCREVVSRKFDWNVTQLEINTDSLDNSGLWSPTKLVDFKEKTFKILMDPDGLRKEVEMLLGIGRVSRGSDAMVAILDDLLEHHGPFGLEYRFVVSSVGDDELEITTKPLVVFQSPGEDVRAIYIRRPPGNFSIPKKAEEAMKESVVAGLINHLSLSDPKAAKIIATGGRGCKSLTKLDDRVRAALGGIVYSKVIELAERPVRLEVTRELNSTKNKGNYSVIVAKLDGPSDQSATD